MIPDSINLSIDSASSIMESLQLVSESILHALGFFSGPVQEPGPARPGPVSAGKNINSSPDTKTDQVCVLNTVWARCVNVLFFC